MAREFYMCDLCKLDKVHMCNYDCINKRSDDFMFQLFTCPKFIYDNGQPINNAEWISILLKSDIDVAANEVWHQTILNDGHIDLGDFKEWLQKEVEDNNND